MLTTGEAPRTAALHPPPNASGPSPCGRMVHALPPRGSVLPATTDGAQSERAERTRCSPVCSPTAAWYPALRATRQAPCGCGSGRGSTSWPFPCGRADSHEPCSRGQGGARFEQRAHLRQRCIASTGFPRRLPGTLGMGETICTPRSDPPGPPRPCRRSIDFAPRKHPRRSPCGPPPTAQLWADVWRGFPATTAAA
jgi:hypothetical protein